MPLRRRGPTPCRVSCIDAVLPILPQTYRTFISKTRSALNWVGDRARQRAASRPAPHPRRQRRLPTLPLHARRRRDPLQRRYIRGKYDALVATEKPPKVAITAVMRKLGILQTGRSKKGEHGRRKLLDHNGHSSAVFGRISEDGARQCRPAKSRRTHLIMSAPAVAA